VRPPSDALVVADGDAPDRAALDAAWPRWADDLGLVVAADGGALAAERLGFAIDLVVGDGDSLGDADLERLRAAGVEIRVVPRDKDETDTELALLEAVRRGAARITIVGALGGPRVDHELANVALLGHPALAGVPAAIVDPRGRITLVDAPAPGGGPVTSPLAGPLGAVVSLLPLDGVVSGVTTAGLRYPLRDESLPLGPARGLSNVRDAPDAAVTVGSGRLLVVEAPATLAR
jgi:thiamine pyrophosphokinase